MFYHITSCIELYILYLYEYSKYNSDKYMTHIFLLCIRVYIHKHIKKRCETLRICICMYKGMYTFISTNFQEI